MTLGVKGRPDLHVVARFLDALAAGPRTRSQLQRGVGVNYDIFLRYLGLMRERGHLADADGKLALTPSGQRLRQELKAWLDGLFGAS